MLDFKILAAALTFFGGKGERRRLGIKGWFVAYSAKFVTVELEIIVM